MYFDKEGKKGGVTEDKDIKDDQLWVIQKHGEEGYLITNHEHKNRIFSNKDGRFGFWGEEKIWGDNVWKIEPHDDKVLIINNNSNKNLFANKDRN